MSVAIDVAGAPPHDCGAKHEHLPLSLLTAAKNGAAGSEPGPLALMGQRSGPHGCNAVSTLGPQHTREEPSPRTA